MGVPRGPCTVLAATMEPVTNRVFGTVLLPRQPLPGEEMDLATRFAEARIPARYEPLSLKLSVQPHRRRQPRQNLRICPDFVIETTTSSSDSPSDRYMLLIEVKRTHTDDGEYTKLFAVTRAFRDRRIEAMMILWKPRQIFTTMPPYAVRRLLFFLGFDPNEWQIRPLAQKARPLKYWQWRVAA